MSSQVGTMAKSMTGEIRGTRKHFKARPPEAVATPELSQTVVTPEGKVVELSGTSIDAQGRLVSSAPAPAIETPAPAAKQAPAPKKTKNALARARVRSPEEMEAVGAAQTAILQSLSQSLFSSVARQIRHKTPFPKAQNPACRW